MATVTEMRAWLRANTGEEVPARGRLDARLIRMYEDVNGSGEAADIPDDPDWDLGEAGDGMASADDLEPSVPMQPERRPRTRRTVKADQRAQPLGQRTGRLFQSLRGDQAKGKPAAKKKTRQRISLESFTARAYSTLGRMVRTMSPATGNCLQGQAAMAGVLLEDMAAGTIVDRLLQGPARAEDKLDKGFALVAPPLLVFAIEQNQAQVAAGVKSPQAGMLRHAMLMPVLRESLRIGLEVSEAHADQIKARLERETRFDQQIDELVGLIFGQVTAEADDEPEMAMA
jgi:hypothetical protein